MPNLAQLREDSARISHELHEVLVEAGPDIDLEKVKRLEGTNEQKVAWMKEQHERLSDLGAQIDQLENLQKIGDFNERVWQRQTQPMHRPPMGANGNGNGSGTDSKAARLLAEHGLRRLIAEHPGYKDLIAGQRTSLAIDIPVADFKTLVTLSDISPQAQRRDVVGMPLEERTVADLPLQGSTDRGSVDYYEETTVTNNAAATAEGIAKPESALGWTLRTEPVRKIATWIPATDEVLADNAFLEGQIRGRLTWMVQRVEEAEVVSGSGVAPHLLGFLGRAIQTYAKQAADANPDAIYQAMQRVRGATGSGFAEPTGVVMNPTNWTAIQLLKTADGLYIWGHPSEPGPERIWGKLVRQTTGIAAGTALVGAFRPHSEVIRRAGITVTLSTEHANNFIENKVTILAEERLALAVYRPSAFCSVTALT